MAGGGGDGNEYEVNINLTALLDVLTNLLFFLMLGFAAQSANMELDGGITLPGSSAEAHPDKTIQVSITRRDIRVDKAPVVTVSAGRVENGPSGNARIEPLYKRLISVKTDKKSKALDVTDIIMVMCDKDTPYGLLHQVLNTAAEAGFPKFRMAVMME